MPGTYIHALYAPQKRAALVRWGEQVRAVVAGTERKIIAFPT